MALHIIPKDVAKRFRFEERGHASAILSNDFPNEWSDVLDCLRNFTLTKTDILTPGGGRSPIPQRIDGFLQEKGWADKSFNIEIVVDGTSIPTPTHSIDNFKNSIGIEVEWNNKTEFFDRDLNNFRLLKELRVISVGIIITRQTELQKEFNRLNKGHSYGASTTHWDKLIPKIDGGGAGGCPLLLIGLGFECYDKNA